MLQRIVFQDNIYQLSRLIDVTFEGLVLDLSGDIFFDKITDDLLFINASIQKMYELLRLNSQISDYTQILHNLYSCQNRYILLLDSILQGKSSMNEKFMTILPKLQVIRNSHAMAISEIITQIQQGDKNTDNHDIVSSNELSELLHF